MTRHKNNSLVLCILLGAGMALAPVATARADWLDGLVFAHDFEDITGNNIPGLFGTPAATKPANLTVNTTSPLSFSTQHLKAPASGNVPTGINTNTQLTEATNALSFSIFYNARNHTETHPVRLLGTFHGSSWEGDPPANHQYAIFDIRNADTETHHAVRFRLPSGAVAFAEDGDGNTLEAPRDDQWHQMGFVFDQGTVRFYLDGQPWGVDKLLDSTITAQDYNWFLIEDAKDVGNRTEYFSDGFYDEAALWTRALSDAEMYFLYSKGLAAPHWRIAFPTRKKTDRNERPPAGFDGLLPYRGWVNPAGCHGKPAHRRKLHRAGASSDRPRTAGTTHPT